MLDAALTYWPIQSFTKLEIDRGEYRKQSVELKWNRSTVGRGKCLYDCGGLARISAHVTTFENSRKWPGSRNELQF